MLRKILRRIPEFALILAVLFSMLYVSSEWLGMRWIAAPLLQIPGWGK
ncbi:MAG TPA: hypothetical protein VN259_04550 [Xanthomonadales bacterium]|nr:hypothetical protein [Xanthomonadales bacterium]